MSSKAGAGTPTAQAIEADDTDGTVMFMGRQADHPITFGVRGMAYWRFVWLVNNLTLDPGLNLDPKVDGECRLNITSINAATAAAGTERILLERVVS